MPPIRVWFEFESFVPGARNLQRCGAHWSGNGRTGFWIPEQISTEDAQSCRYAISGPEPSRSMALNAAERLNRCHDGHRGADWSGHVLFRQALAALGKPVHPSDRVDHVGHIRPAMMDVLSRVAARTLDISYINHEAGLEPEFIGMLLNSILPKQAGPTMVTSVTCGAWPMACWYGEVRRSNPDLFRVLGLRPYVEAWISRRIPATASRAVSPAWVGLIQTINQILSARRAVHGDGIRPIPSVRGILGTHYKDALATTEHERMVYRAQACAMSALGVQDVICFNSYGRGEHLKDPVVDFAIMADEDLQTLDAFELALAVPEVPLAKLPTEPLKLDADEIRLGDWRIRFADLPPF